MCFKKEYKCYKGKDEEDCCNSRVEEAVTHRTNVIILCISVAILIIALTAKTVSNKAFVDQVSFASTVTSIVLSVIAIWMSISGERSTNEIKTKVSDSVYKLVDAVSETKELTDNLKDAISNQTYDLIKEQMEQVAIEMHSMKTSVEEINSSFVNISESKTKKDTPENIFYIFQNIVEGVTGSIQKKEVLEAALKIFEEKNANPDIKLYGAIKSIELLEKDRNVVFGIMVAVAHNGFFDDKSNYNKLQDYINSYYEE